MQVKEEVQPGDLIILIEEEAHPESARDGLNVAFDLTYIIYGCRIWHPCGSSHDRRKSQNPHSGRYTEWKDFPAERERISFSEFI